MESPAVWVAVGGLLTTAVGVVVGAVIKIRRNQVELDRAKTELDLSRRRQETEAEQVQRRDTLAEYGDLLERQRQDLVETREEVKKLRDELDQEKDKHSECERGRARDSERISHLEEALTRAKIPFVKDTGTTEHQTLKLTDPPAREGGKK